MIARILAILIILCPPVFAVEPAAIMPQPDGSVVIVIPAEVVKQCGEDGGCNLISAKELAEFIHSIKPKLCNEREF